MIHHTNTEAEMIKQGTTTKERIPHSETIGMISANRHFTNSSNTETTIHQSEQKERNDSWSTSNKDSIQLFYPIRVTLHSVTASILSVIPTGQICWGLPASIFKEPWMKYQKQYEHQDLSEQQQPLLLSSSICCPDDQRTSTEPEQSMISIYGTRQMIRFVQFYNNNNNTYYNTGTDTPYNTSTRLTSSPPSILSPSLTTTTPPPLIDCDRIFIHGQCDTMNNELFGIPLLVFCQKATMFPHYAEISKDSITPIIPLQFTTHLHPTGMHISPTVETSGITGNHILNRHNRTNNNNYDDESTPTDTNADHHYLTAHQKPDEYHYYDADTLNDMDDTLFYKQCGCDDDDFSNEYDMDYPNSPSNSSDNSDDDEYPSNEKKNWNDNNTKSRNRDGRVRRGNRSSAVSKRQRYTRNRPLGSVVGVNDSDVESADEDPHDGLFLSLLRRQQQQQHPRHVGTKHNTTSSSFASSLHHQLTTTPLPPVLKEPIQSLQNTKQCIHNTTADPVSPTVLCWRKIIHCKYNDAAADINTSRPPKQSKDFTTTSLCCQICFNTANYTLSSFSDGPENNNLDYIITHHQHIDNSKIGNTEHHDAFCADHVQPNVWSLDHVPVDQIDTLRKKLEQIITQPTTEPANGIISSNAPCVVVKLTHVLAHNNTTQHSSHSHDDHYICIACLRRMFISQQRPNQTWSHPTSTLLRRCLAQRKTISTYNYNNRNTITPTVSATILNTPKSADHRFTTLSTASATAESVSSTNKLSTYKSWYITCPLHHADSSISCPFQLPVNCIFTWLCWSDDEQRQLQDTLTEFIEETITDTRIHRLTSNGQMRGTSVEHCDQCDHLKDDDNNDDHNAQSTLLSSVSSLTIPVASPYFYKPLSERCRVRDYILLTSELTEELCYDQMADHVLNSGCTDDFYCVTITCPICLCHLSKSSACNSISHCGIEICNICGFFSHPPTIEQHQDQQTTNCSSLSLSSINTRIPANHWDAQGYYGCPRWDTDDFWQSRCHINTHYHQNDSDHCADRETAADTYLSNYARTTQHRQYHQYTAPVERPHNYSVSHHTPSAHHGGHIPSVATQIRPTISSSVNVYTISSAASHISNTQGVTRTNECQDPQHNFIKRQMNTIRLFNLLFHQFRWLRQVNRHDIAKNIERRLLNYAEKMTESQLTREKLYIIAEAARYAMLLC